MIYEIIFLILGLVGLILSSSLVIKGALNIARHYKISELFMGLTILAIGTDLPELFISITGAIQRLGGIETSGLIIGETIGSTLGQTLLAVGLLGLFGTIFLTKREIKRDGMMMIGSVILFFLAGLDGIITRIEGIAFVLIYIFYFLSLYREEKIKEKVTKAPPMQFGWDTLSIIVGLGLLVFSAKLVLDNGVSLAELWGVPQSLIGILLLGLGTSLPEISVSLMALYKGSTRLSVGNLIGSNIFDILFALGIGSAISGFIVSKSLLWFDIVFLFGACVLVLIFFRTERRISKIEAGILLLTYLIYLILKFMGY